MTTYTLKDFSRLLGTPGFSDKLLKQHFELYGGYVKSANSLAEELSIPASTPPKPSWSELKRRFGWEWNGMRLHELYFENMTKTPAPLGKNSPLLGKLGTQFGSFEKWEHDFKATGSLRGIGWAALLHDPVGGRFYNAWIDEHDSGHLAGTSVLLLMDVFEHAFLTDYGTKRADYIEAFVRTIDWSAIEGRFATSTA
jgi:Fe-Mn family superoxide dismutase